MNDRSQEYVWQKDRKRPDIPAVFQPIRGYGPEGSYTLWLPPATIVRKSEFIDGKPRIVKSDALQNDPQLQLLREQVLATTRTTGDDSGAILLADICMLEYSAELIKRGYNVDDNDLNMLHSGNRWMEPILIHAMGGMDQVSGWQSARVEDVIQIPTAVVDEPASIVVTETPQQGFELD